MDYPFFLASVPTPSVPAGTPPPWSSARFLDEASRNLSAADLDVLRALASDAPCSHPFVRAWRDFDTQLRNACARLRAAKRGVDARPYLHEHDAIDGSLDRRVQSVFQSAPDPLARERALDALRLERLSTPPENPFSLDAVLALFLRIRLAERSAAPDPDAGRDRLAQAASAAER